MPAPSRAGATDPVLLPPSATCCTSWRGAGPCRLVLRGSAAAAGAERGEGLVEDRLAVLVGAALLHVREVGLVGLVLRRSGRVRLVLAGGVPAARAVPGGRGLVAGLLREAGPGLVPVRAPVGDADAGCAVAALRLAHGPGAYARAADGTATRHGLPPLLSRS